jgi:hypothetical protein
MSIPTHPFFIAGIDREAAERTALRSGHPVLRTSSVEGHYAVTYYCPQRHRIIHTLLRQKADNSIEVVHPTGIVCGYYTDVTELLACLTYRPPVLPTIAPALLPLLPVVARGCDEDPC